MRVGDPEDPQTQIGAITLREQYEKIKDYCEIGVAEGARALFGGAPTSLGDAFADGLFWSPTAFEAQNSHRIAREEIFGPVATFVRFYGRSRSDRARECKRVRSRGERLVYRTSARANRVARAIRSGSVAINTPYAVFPGVPFGGYKQSGYGRELGMETMRHLHAKPRACSPTSGKKRWTRLG